MREKKFININKLIAEIWKVKRLEKKKYLKWLKNNWFYKKWHPTGNIISIVNSLCSRYFFKKGKLHVRSYSEQGGRLRVASLSLSLSLSLSVISLFLFFCFVLFWVCFFRVFLVLFTFCFVFYFSCSHFATFLKGLFAAFYCIFRI